MLANVVAAPTFQPTALDNPKEGSLLARAEARKKEAKEAKIPIPKLIRTPSLSHLHHHHHHHDQDTGVATAPSSSLSKKILTPADLTAFHGSDTYSALVSFVDDLNASVINTPNDASCTVSTVSFCPLMHWEQVH